MRSFTHLPGLGAPARLMAGAVVASVLPAVATAAPVTSFVAPPVPSPITTAVPPAPTIAAGGSVVAWTEPGSDGRWSLRVATGGTAITKAFDHQRWPVDVSIGTPSSGAPTVLFSRCPHSTAATRVRASGCDLYRLSSASARGRVLKLGGGSTSAGSETAPSLDGHTLVFGRRAAGATYGSVIARDTRTGREVTLPGGDRGTCTGECAKDGFAAGAALATSVDGTRFGELWESINGPDTLGIGANDQILRGSLTTRRLGEPAGTSVVSGTCGSVQFASLQQLGTSTQTTRHAYTCDGPAPAPGSLDVVQRTTAGGHVTQYADPQGRRIVAAASSGSTLWLIREINPVTPSTTDAPPAFCTAPTGGCEVDSVTDPAFVAATRNT